MAKKAKTQPGIMLYFSEYDVAADLTYECKGRLLDAIIYYGLRGELPDFSGVENEADRRELTVAWKTYKHKVELDFARYIKTKESKIRANKIKYIRAHPDCGLDPLEEDDIARVVKGANGKLCVSPVPIYSEDENEYEFFPHQIESCQCKEVERKLMQGGQVMMTEEQITQKIREELVKLAGALNGRT